jgi:hypothetical protein
MAICKAIQVGRLQSYDEPLFRLWIKPGLSAEEWAEAAHAIARILVDPPRPMAERRRVAVRQCLAQYQGARSNRAKMLEHRLKSYLTSGWRLEHDMETLPEFLRTPERTCLHRLAKLNKGASLSWRQIYDIAASSPQD